MSVMLICRQKSSWNRLVHAPAGFHRTTALSSIETWSSVHGEARSTAGAGGAAEFVGVSAACGVSTSIASSLLAGVAVVDARPFFLGGIVARNGGVEPRSLTSVYNYCNDMSAQCAVRCKCAIPTPNDGASKVHFP